MTDTLAVKITSITPPTYEKTSGPDKATVSSRGDIDVSELTNSVDIEWTLKSDLNEVFKPLSPEPGPITITPANTEFSAAVLSNSDRTVTVPDANSANQTTKVYNYILHQQRGQMDPSIKNR